MILPYCYLALTTGSKFYSPDETANFIFAKNIAENNSLKIDIAINKEVDNIIFPRSVNVLDGYYVPMSFLGLPIFYGLIGKIIGANNITFITPLISLVAGFILFSILKQLFDKNIALISAIILLLNPVYWYLAGKGLLHNNLFIFFVLLGLFLLIKALKRQQLILFFISALLFGASIWTRTSEIFWIGLLLLIFYWYNRKNVNWKGFLAFVVGFCGMLSLLLFINYETYGNILRSGYSALDQSAKTTPASLLMQIILPLGFNLRNIMFHSWEFLFKYLWLLILPAIWGLIAYRKQPQSEPQKAYYVICFIVSTYLIISYGSYWPWGEYGQPNDPTFLIGGPHLRYWNPLLIFLTPFIAFSLWELLPRLFKNVKFIKPIFLTVFFALLIIFSSNQVLFEKQEGFLKIKNDILDFQPRLDKVNATITPEAILIIPDWADRIFFPDYQVIHSLGDKRIYAGDAYAQVGKLVQIKPIYLYSSDSQADMAELNKTLTKYNLSLNFITDIYKGEKLYQIKNAD